MPDTLPESPEPEWIEETTCTCGAGHGSLEGHLEWCAWVAMMEDSHAD